MRRKISIILAVLLVISSVNTTPVLAAQNEQESMGNPEGEGLEQKVPQERKFSKKQKRKLKEIEAASETSGLETAEILEEIEEDEELYEYSLKNTLEKYYNEPETYGEQLADIKENVECDAAEEVIAEYEAALEERSQADELNYNTENIIVVFEPETDESYIESVAEEQFGELEETNITEDIDVTGLTEKKVEQIQNVSQIEEDTVAVVDISLGQTVEQAVEEYSQYENVKYAEPDYLLSASGLTVDTYSNQQWHLNHIKMKEAWYALQTSGMSETWIAVIDSGIKVSHPDLKNVYIKNKSVDVTKSGYPKLSDLTQPYAGDHGTLVSGAVAAEANNGKGIAGVATGGDPSAFRLMAIKAVRPETPNYDMYTSDLVNGIYYAVDNGADVINISYGWSDYSQIQQDAVNYAYNANVPIVASAGNKNCSAKNYPAAYKNVISVAATDQNNKRVVKSYWGSNYGDFVDIAAPGVDIKTTAIKSTYEMSEGTSLAAPIVTGVIAIMKSITFGNISVNGIQQILTDSATKLSISNLGAGVVNGGLAVQMAKYSLFKDTKENFKTVAATSTSGNLKLTWNDGAASSEGYIIYRSASKDGTYKAIKTITNPHTSSYTDKGLKKGKTYYYKIRGYMNYGSGKKYNKYSAIKSGKPN